ncbi:metal-dependent hydrolase [Natrinema versiforme]|uniref:Metal-dependent hydrolase n=1 Tax=Natrinema versiforme TaxID=88724 RepID=A0A4P8WK46_9EURY|nr:metal-dependent hydrolase [Natrinema versiforme]QCS42463.1 metal-dependent hydrolase [Natrinema versiforme]
MMLPTHALLGLAIAAPFVVFAPELAPAALIGGFLGGVLPDLDLYAGHRRTLHYPTLYVVASVPIAIAAALIAAPWLVTAAFLLVGAALHCRMDRYGGGLELRPWEGTSDRAVYDHVRRRWRAPKRWVRYDGAPEDLLLAALAGVPLWILLDGPFRWLVGAALLVGGLYVLFRRRLANAAPVVFDAVPEPVDDYVPNRYKQ